MGERNLTKAQRYWLERFLHGWTLPNPSRAPAPLRRLIKRRLLEKTGVVQGRPYYQASALGRSALEASK